MSFDVSFRMIVRDRSNRRVKVLHVQGSAAIGGIAKLVFDLATAQKNDRRLDIGIFFMSGCEHGYGEMYKQAGLPIYSAGVASGYDVSPWKYVRTYRIFRRYDVLHIHNFNLFISAAAILARKKLIYTEHGNFILGRRPTLADRVNAWLLRLFLNRFVHFVTFNSRFTEEGARRRYGLVNVNAELIYNGIVLDFPAPNQDGERLDPEIAEQLKGKFVVGTSSRFAAFKRIDRLIAAFAHFQRGKNTVLLLVGDGPLMPQFNAHVHRHRLHDKVVFTGFRTDVRKLQRAMDVCVFPSEHEPFGLVAVEVLSLGKPVIVFRDGGGLVEIAEICGKDDIVDNHDELIARLNYYYNNKSVLEERRKQRIACAGRFDIREVARRFKSLYLKSVSCAE
jgi:glycosyltransferase involved in cell wall biosynthesis